MKLLKFDRKTFNERFGSKMDCYQHLAELKWGDGYTCRRCNCSLYIKGKQPYSRRCSSCGYDKSTTTGTLFHKLKFGIDKAFEMLYEISTSKKGANSVWLAERFGVQQNTAWLFRQKVQKAMVSSGNHPLEDEVQELIGEDQLVIKPVDDTLKNLSYLSGIAVLGKGELAFLLDSFRLKNSLTDFGINEDSATSRKQL